MVAFNDTKTSKSTVIRRTRVALVLGALVAGSFSAVGCGGDDSSGGSGGTSSTGTTSHATGTATGNHSSSSSTTHPSSSNGTSSSGTTGTGSGGNSSSGTNSNSSSSSATGSNSVVDGGSTDSGSTDGGSGDATMQDAGPDTGTTMDAGGGDAPADTGAEDATTSGGDGGDATVEDATTDAGDAASSETDASDASSNGTDASDAATDAGDAATATCPAGQDAGTGGCAVLTVPMMVVGDRAWFDIDLPAATDFTGATISAQVIAPGATAGIIQAFVQEGAPNYAIDGFGFRNLADATSWTTFTWNVASTTDTQEMRVALDVETGLAADASASFEQPATVVYVSAITVTLGSDASAAVGPYTFPNASSISTTQFAPVLWLDTGDGPVAGSTLTWLPQ